MNMKRYLTTLIALVTIVMGAKAAVIDYGFKICGNAINSGNYQLINRDKPWYYDPENNVLHLTDGKLSSNGVNYLLEVNSDVNSSLTIQVDGYFETGYLQNRAIVFNGEGTHTICGEGKLNIEPQLTNVSGMIKSFGKTKLTIKDLTLNITTYGSIDVGFENSNFSEIILDNCEINIHSGFSAWYGYANRSVDPILINCFLKEGVFYGGGIVEYAGSRNWRKDIFIIRQHPITNAAITVDNPTADEVVPNSCQIDNDHCTAELSWVIVNGDNSINNVTPGSVFELGKVYRAVVRLESTSEYPFSSDASITINGHQASINVIENGAAAIVTYTFPQLANTYYDVWVGGKQVNDINKSDVLDDGGSVSFIKNVFGKYVLILENANITNTGDTQYDYTGYGRGIYSNLSGLTIRVKGNNTIDSKGEGIYFTGNLDISGTTDNQGKLSVKGSYGIRPAKSSTAITLDISRVELTAEGTSGTGIGASTSLFGSSYNCTMKVGIANTVVKAKGTSVSLGNLNDLVFEDGLDIVQPTGASFNGQDVIDANGNIIKGSWVIIKGESGISTGVALPQDKAQSQDAWYTLDGRKLNGQPTKKGVYIHNGKTVIR